MAPFAQRFGFITGISQALNEYLSSSRELLLGSYRSQGMPAYTPTHFRIADLLLLRDYRSHQEYKVHVLQICLDHVHISANHCLRTLEAPHESC